MTRSLLAERRFGPLFACQFLSAFGDNFLRNALGLLVVWSSRGAPGWIVAAASGAFVLPSVLLSGLGGQLADRMDKARLIRRLKLAEVLVAGVATLGLAAGSLPVLFAGLVASGVVSALFGPVKYGILPDQLPRERLTGANALVEGATFAAILAGTVASGMLVGAGFRPLAIGLVVLAAAGLSWATALLVPATIPSVPTLRVQANVLASTLDLVRGLRTDRRIRRAVLASAWFWMAGSVVISLLPGLVRDTLGGGAAMDTALLCLFAVGIACGSGLASFLSGGRTVLLPAGLGCAILGLALADLWRVSHGLAQAPVGHAGADLFAAALGGGLLAVPAQAAVQAFSPPERRSRTVAGGNVVSALAVAATAVLLIAAQLAGLREPALLGIAGLLCFLASAVMLAALPANPGGEAAWVLFRVLFRLRLHGAEHLPRLGQAVVVVLPGHAGWLDAAALLAVMEAPPLFVIDAQVARRWWVRPLLRLVPALPVEAGSPSATRLMVQAVRAGARLVLFPEGGVTVTGRPTEAQHGAASIADEAGVPVVPVRVEGLERAPFSRLARGEARRALFPAVTVTVLPQRQLQAPGSGVGRARREALAAGLRDAMEEAVASPRRSS